MSFPASESQHLHLLCWAHIFTLWKGPDEEFNWAFLNNISWNTCTFKANKAKVGKTVKRWKSPPKTCMSSFPGCWASGPSNCIRLRTIHDRFCPNALCCHPLNSTPRAPRESPHTPWCVQAFTKPLCYPSLQSGNALLRGTPQAHCHSQKQILPEGFNFLCSLFAELLYLPRYLWRPSSVCLQASISVTSSYICSNGHITQRKRKNLLSRSVSCMREPLGWWEREGGKPTLLPPGELNSLWLFHSTMCLLSNKWAVIRAEENFPIEMSWLAKKGD